MGLKQRINIVFKSQLNHWVTQAEDPEKILNQAVEDMEEGLNRVKARVAGLKFRISERERILRRISKQLSYWQEKAEDFIRDDMEENARDSLRKRRILEEEERRQKIKQAEDEATEKEIEQAYKELESRVQLAKTKRNILLRDIRLTRTMTANTREPGVQNEVSIEEPFSIVRKMEERIMEEEIEAASRQEKEKEAWEREEKLINEEIEILKRNVKKGGTKK